MKKIEDYLHLYLGCEIKAITKWRNYTIGNTYKLNTAILNDFELNLRTSTVICKPILRPLSDINVQECKELNWVFPVTDSMTKSFLKNLSPYEFLYLLSKHFDLFGLIKAGLAIRRDARLTK